MSSNKFDYILTFEWDSDNEALEIHGNKKGLEKLKNMIDLLLNKTTDDHAHLMTEDWGGNELSEESQCSDNELINHVKLFIWT